MLESDIIDERRAALAHAFFLPFMRIKQALLRFIIRESEPALLVQAGQLLIINPDNEVAKSVALIAAEATADKAPVLKSILAKQCEFLARIKLIEETPEEHSSRLLDEAAAIACQKQLASLSSAVRNGQIQSETDLTQAIILLKQKFSLNLPTASLQPVVESLAELDPAFLQPHLPALLQIRDISIQIAALSAMAKTNPVMAEKMLEQYLCSASPARRRSGIMVLSRLDPTFALPLLLKTLAQESDKDLLYLIEQQLDQPLPHAQLTQLLKQAGQAEECNERQDLLNRLCLAAGITPDASENSADTDDFSQEKIMLGRAEKSLAGQFQQQTRQPETAAEPAEAASSKRSKFISQFRALPSFARIQLIIETIVRHDGDREELDELMHSERDELQLFALQSALAAIELQSHRSFSPVQTLRHNLSQTVPVWNEVAACLAKMPAEAARLIAPMLQQMRWTSWPETVLPFMLRFIAITARPMFSASVNRLLRHPRPEIRCAAISCLQTINPGDLAEVLTALTTDKNSEVADLARKTTREIERQQQKHGLSTGFLNRIKFFADALQQLSTLSQAALAGIMVLLLSIFLLASRPASDSANAVAKIPPPGRNSPQARKVYTMHRFEHWRQPAEIGQERVIFGQIEENYADSLLLRSPALQAHILVRHKLGVLPLKKNQHFNGLVKIDSVDATRIESTLLLSQENKR